MTKGTGGVLPWRRRRDERPRVRLLGVLLCYNDGDLVEDAVRHLREQGHHLVVWDHGSTDETPQILRRLEAELVELQTIPRSVDFYGLYQAMSAHLLESYVAKYDWVSWPDQDEFLEGPDRSRSYRDWLEEVARSPYDWIQFNNFNFWWTEVDDPAVARAVRRVRHYSLFADCGPRIRSWRASSTNIREFNHNPPLGERYPRLFNLRHYPMRSEAQMTRRLAVDRAGLRRGGANFHYDNMSAWPDRLAIPPEKLHFDDGGELDPSVIFNWRSIYGDENSRTRQS
jgi:glycosyltransferase involved in cell wall biosynthesis